MIENLMFKKNNIQNFRLALQTFNPEDGEFHSQLFEEIEDNETHSMLSITASENTIAQFKSHLFNYLL